MRPWASVRSCWAPADRPRTSGLCPLQRLGLIQARWGEAAAAWESLDKAIGYADRAREPQSIVPVRLARAEAFWLEGNLADAHRAAKLGLAHSRPLTAG